MRQYIQQAICTDFADCAKNVIKYANSVKRNSSYNSIAMVAKKSNAEESSWRKFFKFFCTYFQFY